MDTRKILIALQFWEADKAMAMKVAQLIADLEPRLSEKADFLFMSRFDCGHDMDIIKYVSAKFNTHVQVNRRRGAEWPFGCNELWFGTMDWVYSMREANLIPDYKAILTMEADSCPMTQHWITELSNQWDKAGKKIVGPLVPAPAEHINGNALFSGDLRFLKWISREVGGCSPHGGWDFILAGEFKRQGWANCPAMRSWWRMLTLPRQTFDGLIREGVVFLHGVKDDSVISHVRKKFLR